MSGIRKFRFVFAIITVSLHLSCGIESYTYIDPVFSVTATMNDRAEIRLLPSNDNDRITIDFTTGKIPRLTIVSPTKTFGTDYEIYYRIYLSDTVISTVNTNDTRSSVNATLASDWTAMEPYTVESNNLSSSVASLFSTRKYYPLQLSSSGNLIRSNGNGAFNPVPSDRQFSVTEDLLNTANITANINADITGMASGTPRYAYASMYIVMRSFDPQTLTPIFSTPTFINIFLLPSNIPTIPVTGISLTVPPNAGANPAVKLTAVVTPSNATNTDVRWSLSDDTVAGLRDVGGNAVIVYSLGTGRPVTVTVTTLDGGYTASSNGITLSGVAATGITGVPTNLTLTVGEKQTLPATVVPSAATNQTVTWVSSDPNVVSVEESTGEVEAIAAGDAVITATTTDGTELGTTCAITVVAATTP